MLDFKYAFRHRNAMPKITNTLPMPRHFGEKQIIFFDETLPKIGASLASRINDNFQVLKSAS